MITHSYFCVNLSVVKIKSCIIKEAEVNMVVPLAAVTGDQEAETHTVAHLAVVNTDLTEVGAAITVVPQEVSMAHQEVSMVHQEDLMVHQEDSMAHQEVSMAHQEVLMAHREVQVVLMVQDVREVSEGQVDNMEDLVINF
ncbi:unnamed protein product [Ceutorhynchus assimilis]|uniref:Uncharacterized protein n=1 Tax=Ceutorhynchus assimilis TaxID=467358 RepID=A0A9N9QD86_9CUCU|nr:unnamed protein product [Ceutorhynchus assimilis]